MQIVRWAKAFVGIAAVAAIGVAGYLTREHWQSGQSPPANTLAAGSPEDAAPPADRVVLSEQAQANLALQAQPLKAGSYWKTISVPGMIVDRPGQGDRSIVAPVNGVINSIDYVPGDTVRPGNILFTIRILSDSLHQTQTELFKAAQDMKLSQSLRNRLAASGSVVPEARLIELDNQIARFDVAARAYRQDLLSRGLSSEQIAGVADGKFVNEIAIAVPIRPTASPRELAALAGPGTSANPAAAPLYEVQELKVELGQYVQAGQTLCLLANHQVLTIEGRAFREETPLIERAVREGWPVEADFQEPTGTDWPSAPQPLHIAKLGSTIDPANRTFAFYVPLDNQSRTIEQQGRTQRLWRFRPGQKVRLLVPVEKLDNVFVLPADAVTFDGPESFAFTQNVDTFQRKPVRVLAHDQRQIVIANDGAVLPGAFAVQAAAAQLNRMVKSQSSTVPKGFHMHADGSIHKNGEPD